MLVVLSCYIGVALANSDITAILGHPTKPETWLATTTDALWEFNITSCALLLTGSQGTTSADLRNKCDNSSSKTFQFPFKHLTDILHIDFTSALEGHRLSFISSGIVIADFGNDRVLVLDLHSLGGGILIGESGSLGYLPVFHHTLHGPSQLIYHNHPPVSVLKVFQTTTNPGSFMKSACILDHLQQCTDHNTRVLSGTSPSLPIQLWRTDDIPTFSAQANEACVIQIASHEYRKCIKTGATIGKNLFFVDKVNNGLESVDMEFYHEKTRRPLHSNKHCIPDPYNRAQCVNIMLLEKLNSSFLLLMTANEIFLEVNATQLLSTTTVESYYLTTTDSVSWPHARFQPTEAVCEVGSIFFLRGYTTDTLESCAYACMKIRGKCNLFTFTKPIALCRICY